MTLEKLSLILAGVACGCLVLLCIIVIFLCVSVKRIRQRLEELTGNGTRHLAKGNNNDQEQGRRGNSYTGEPVAKPPRVPSAVYQDPGETVTRLERETGQTGLISSGCLVAPGVVGLAAASGSFLPSFKPESCTQDLDMQHPVEKTPQKSEKKIFEYVNEGYSPDCRLHSSPEDSSDVEPSEPIYGNEEVFSEQPIYENTDGEEEIYQNTGELRTINNPESIRRNTMDISKVH